MIRPCRPCLLFGKRPGNEIGMGGLGPADPSRPGLLIAKKDMKMVSFINRAVDPVSKGFNMVAALSVVAMMLVTCLDVVLRYLRMPIPGTYEVVGLLGTVVTSFALARTTLEQGHIAVDFLVKNLSPKNKRIIFRINDAVSAVLFAFISRHTYLYGMDLLAKKEVSLTLQIPIFPFVFGISLGCALMVVVLAGRALSPPAASGK